MTTADTHAEAATVRAELGNAADTRHRWDKGRRFAFALLSGDRLVVGLLLLLPFVVWSPALLGLVHANGNYVAQLGTNTRGYLSGQPTIDPNIGFTSQALGHQAAMQWLSGVVPWWNPYEGVGVPLAGEMQSAAFLPLTLLLKFDSGQLAFHIALQIIAGIATYYLLRQLRLSRVASGTGAILFEFNGVFALLGNAVVNPVAFLPLLLLGVERAYASATSPQPGGVRWLATGWKWIAVALALSYLAGFPEGTYINGLLVAIWVIVRLVLLGRWGGRARFVAKVGIGFAVGTMVAAPLLMAFATYLPYADTGLHASTASTLTVSADTLPLFFHPYVAGGILSVPETGHLMGTGGYIGLTAAFLALLGVWGRRERALRIALFGWIIVALGKTLGIEPFMALVNSLPLAKVVVFFRYANASWIMAAIILLAFALDEWRGTRLDKVKVVACAAIALIVVSLGSLWLIKPLLGQLRFDHGYSLMYLVLSVGAEWVSVLVLVAAFLAGSTRTREEDARAESIPCTPIDTTAPVQRQAAPIIAGALVTLLAMGYFMVPMLSYPRSATIDTRAIQFLQDHIGYNRFFTLGPFTANYGSYYNVASINDNDLPLPLAWDEYIHQHLDPYGTDLLFITFPRADPSMPDLATVMSERLDAYEQVGVKYVVACPCQHPFSRLPRQAQPKLVYHDSVMDMYELPHPAPLFGAQDGGCDVQPRSWSEADVRCAAPSTLIRRSLSFPGWHAQVNGHEVPIATYGSIFEEVAVPAGSSRVAFWYLPPHEVPAIAACILALMLLAAATGVSLFAGGPSRLLRRREPEKRDGGGQAIRWRDMFASVLARMRVRGRA